MKSLFFALFFLTAVSLVEAQTQAQIDSINTVLENVLETDQGVRVNLGKLSASGNNEALMEQYRLMHQTDSVNQQIVAKILDSFAEYPQGLSQKANRAVFLVIDHGSLVYALKYLDLVKEQTSKGVFGKSDYATLYDRVLMMQGKPQIYGTQTIGINGEAYLWPVDDADKLAELRKEANLQPIDEYLKIVSQMYGYECVWDKAKTVDDFSSIYFN